MKTAVLFAEGFEEIEAIAVVDIIRRAKIECTMVSVTGEKIVSSARAISVITDKNIEDINFEEYGVIILPGGMPGTKNLAENKMVEEVILKFKAQNKILAAICAAPMIYGNLGLLKGEKAVCYPGCEDSLKGAEVSKDRVMVSNQFITSRGAGTALEFGLKIVETIKGKEEAENIAKAIILKE
jgi:protein deglycase